MWNGIKGWLLGACVVAAAGCAGQHVSTDYSPSIDFGQFHSYSLVTSPDSASHQLLNDRVAQAVQSQLAAKGLTPTDRANANLFVGYGVVDHTHTQVYTTGTGWGWGGGWGWRYHRWGVAWPMTMQRDVQTYTDGTVVVNLVDAKTKRVVWRGEVADVLNLPVSDPTQATQKIDAAVATMFAKYPPQTAAGTAGTKAGTS
jgi:hypothetical protein